MLLVIEDPDAIREIMYAAEPGSYLSMSGILAYGSEDIECTVT